MSEIWHHGILGQKRGIRRFQNEDGSLTEAGRLRYLKGDGTLTKKGEKELSQQARSNVRVEQYVEQYRKTLNEKHDIKEALRLATTDPDQFKSNEESLKAAAGYNLIGTLLATSKNAKIDSKLLGNSTRAQQIERAQKVAKDLGFENLDDDELVQLYGLMLDYTLN